MDLVVIFNYTTCDKETEKTNELNEELQTYCDDLRVGCSNLPITMICSITLERINDDYVLLMTFCKHVRK